MSYDCLMIGNDTNGRRTYPRKNRLEMWQKWLTGWTSSYLGVSRFQYSVVWCKFRYGRFDCFYSIGVMPISLRAVDTFFCMFVAYCFLYLYLYLYIRLCLTIVCVADLSLFFSFFLSWNGK